jgi:hypothetical protein
MVIVGAGRSLELPRSRGFVQQGVAADDCPPSLRSLWPFAAERRYVDMERPCQLFLISSLATAVTTLPLGFLCW